MEKQPTALEQLLMQYSAKKPWLHGSFVSPHGYHLDYHISPHEIRFSDSYHPYTFFQAHIKTNGFAEFHIKTTPFPSDNNRHPDFFAKRLFKASMSFFLKHTPTLKGIAAEWVEKGGINYDMFVALAGPDLIFPDDEKGTILFSPFYGSLEEAALNTWTGNIARELGFGSLSSLHLSKINNLNNVKAFFTRHKPHSYTPHQLPVYNK